MKKYKVYILLYLLLVLVNLPAVDNKLVGQKLISPFPGPYELDFISDSQLILRWESGKPDTNYLDNRKEYNYTLVKKKGLLFLKIDGSLPRNLETGIYSNISEQDYPNEILLLLSAPIPGERYTNYIGLVDGHYNSVFFRKLHNYEGLARQYSNETSFLTEGSIKYEIDNLNKLEEETSWVEGVEGDGKNESFVIKDFWDTKFPYLLIINGYISADKPHLYEENNRVKTIKVEGLKSNKSEIMTVLDTPHPQTLDINFLDSAQDIKITILDVYKGSKYNDTAIHYLITYDSKVIPYE